MTTGSLLDADMLAGTVLSRLSARFEPLALICGLPSSLTYFAADLCRDLLAREHGACEVINFNDLSANTIERIRTTSTPILLLAEVPDATVADLALEAGFPILIIDQGFMAACYDFMAARGANMLDTARTIARAQIGLFALADIPRSVLIGADEHGPASMLVERIASELSISTDLCRPMIDSRNLSQSVSEILQASFPGEQIQPNAERDALLTKLDSFYGFQGAGRLAEWQVPIGVLLEAQPPHLPATNAIELLGPARCLTLGPYLYLPAGRWVLHFCFRSTDNISTNVIGFDVTADEKVKFTQDYTLDKSGKFEFKCDFEISNAFYPFEFRTFLRRGAIEGRLLPESLLLAPI